MQYTQVTNLQIWNNSRQFDMLKSINQSTNSSKFQTFIFKYTLFLWVEKTRREKYFSLLI